MKIKKQTIIVMICLIAIFMLYGCSIPIPFLSSTSSEAIPYTAFLDNASTYDEILELLKTSMANNEPKCKFHVPNESLIDAESWMNDLHGITQIHCEYRKTKNGFNVVVDFEYWDNYAIVYAYKTNDTSKLVARQLELYNKYIEVLDTYTSSSRSDCANELAIHDYLITHIEYEEQKDSIYNAYDALIKGKSVCSGYTECFKTFMDMLGIPNTTITGTAGNQQHIWNMVQLDGDWYQVDVTWDDPVGSNATYVDHAYFNITDKDMALDHTWDDSQNNGLTALGTKYSYPKYAGLINVSSQAQLNSYIVTSIYNRASYLEFTSDTTLDIKAALTASDTTLSYSYKISERTGYSIYVINLSYQ